MNAKLLFLSGLFAVASLATLLPSCGDDEAQVSSKRLSSEDEDEDPSEPSNDDNHGDGRLPQPTPEPTFTAVNVDVLDLLIAPVKVDGAPWDGFGSVSDETVRELLSLIGQLTSYPTLDQVSTFVARLFNLFSDGLEKPDPIGRVKIDEGSGWTDEMPFDGGEDTFLSEVGASYIGAPYARTRVLIEVWDEDLVNDDRIGSAVITTAHIQEAVRRGEAIWVKTATSSADRILLVKIAAQGR